MMKGYFKAQLTSKLQKEWLTADNRPQIEIKLWVWVLGVT